MNEMSKLQKSLIIGGAVVFVVSVLIIIVAPEIALELSYGEVNDGLDREPFAALLNEYTKGIRLAGGIASFLGGFEAICAYYFYPKEKSNE